MVETEGWAMRMRMRMGAGGAAVAVAGLLVAGCGSSGGSGGKIDTGEDGKGRPTASASASGTPKDLPSGTAAASVPPEITLPKDFTLDFSGWRKTGNAAKDAVLADAQNFIRGLSSARAYHKHRGPFVYYAEGDAAAAVDQEISSMETHKGGVTITGTDRYFRDAVTLRDSTHASVSYCEDQSKAYSKVIKTGKVLVKKATPASFLFFDTVLEKGANGTWKTVRFTATQAASCRR